LSASEIYDQSLKESHPTSNRWIVILFQNQLNYII
jgi:hypothetical protein